MNIEELKPGRIIRHPKTGGVYRVLNIAVDTEDRSRRVIYEDINAKPDDEPWVRPLWMFQTPGRFEFVNSPVST
jgi:hypothetical protein